MATLTFKPTLATVARRGFQSQAVFVSNRSRRSLRTTALLGPDGKPGSQTDKKKLLTREAEPEQYWSSKSEMDGANPLKDPLAVIGILGIFFPFILLAVAIAAGYIDLSVYR